MSNLRTEVTFTCKECNYKWEKSFSVAPDNNGDPNMEATVSAVVARSEGRGIFCPECRSRWLEKKD
ncbi:MAG: hypothetical protein HQ536_01465 [Parcubacteria group bacterium]|nr:hypothetical protein [Parcubacteria group bacterium]